MSEDCFHLGLKAIIFNEGNKVLLLKGKNRKGLIYWDIPGGRIQKDEDVLCGLKREVFEETGIDSLQEISPICFSLSEIRFDVGSANFGLIYYFFQSRAENAEVKLSHEHHYYEWCDLKEAIVKIEKDAPKELLYAMNTLLTSLERATHLSCNS